MTTQLNDQLPPDTDRIGSRMSRIDPDIFRDQVKPDKSDEQERATPDEPEENVFSDEPIDDAGKPIDEGEPNEVDN